MKFNLHKHVYMLVYVLCVITIISNVFSDEILYVLVIYMTNWFDCLCKRWKQLSSCSFFLNLKF